MGMQEISYCPCLEMMYRLLSILSSKRSVLSPWEIKPNGETDSSLTAVASLLDFQKHLQKTITVQAVFNRIPIRGKFVALFHSLDGSAVEFEAFAFLLWRE